MTEERNHLEFLQHVYREGWGIQTYEDFLRVLGLSPLEEKLPPDEIYEERYGFIKAAASWAIHNDLGIKPPEYFHSLTFFRTLLSLLAHLDREVTKSGQYKSWVLLKRITDKSLQMPGERYSIFEQLIAGFLLEEILESPEGWTPPREPTEEEKRASLLQRCTLQIRSLGKEFAQKTEKPLVEWTARESKLKEYVQFIRDEFKNVVAIDSQWKKGSPKRSELDKALEVLGFPPVE